METWIVYALGWAVVFICILTWKFTPHRSLRETLRVWKRRFEPIEPAPKWPVPDWGYPLDIDLQDADTEAKTEVFSKKELGEAEYLHIQVGPFHYVVGPNGYLWLQESATGEFELAHISPWNHMETPSKKWWSDEMDRVGGID